MNTVFTQVKNALGKPYEDLHFLLTCFKEVLEENSQHRLAGLLPWLTSTVPARSELTSSKYIHMMSICFQLLNLVEVNGAVQSRRRKEHQDMAQVNGLWANQLRDLTSRGITGAQILNVLPGVLVEPVLTAHPTEAKRAVVLQEYRALYLLLVKRENQMYTRIEQAEIRQEIRQILHRLWHVGEIYIEKPRLASELDNILHYLTRVFPGVVVILDKRLRQAWHESGLDPAALDDPDSLPMLSFGNWVGGDRDGHPLVTPEITIQTLEKLRIHAFYLIRNELNALAQKLSIYHSISEVSTRFAVRIKALRKETRNHADAAPDAHTREIFKAYVLMLIQKLPIDSGREPDPELEERPNGYRSAGDLIADLKLLYNELETCGIGRVARVDVGQTVRMLKIFGFHLAKLDIRQNSAYYETALRQLVTASLGARAAERIDASRADRRAFLDQELKINRPFLVTHNSLDAEGKNVIGVFKVVSDHLRRYSPDAFGKFIVSMTRNTEDLLMVYLFMREVGLIVRDDDQPGAVLPVVPLFETIEDLKSSTGILDDYLGHPVVRASLQMQSRNNPGGALIQDVMIGYSDSNKDGGVLASAWFLHDAQRALTRVGERHGVKIRFFHGTGGSISRGAGPSHWFIKTLPHGSINGKFRVTEQGETIERKYANLVNAAYNLELMVSSVTAQTVLHENSQVRHEALDSLFHRLGDRGRHYYQQLISDPDFITFFSQATPIDVIESSKIGSRPARRTGKRSMEDLRAIPWVFSWSQSRFNITSWYGVGSTLNELKNENPGIYDSLLHFVEYDPFARYVMTNLDSSLASTDLRIMEKYASLVEDTGVRDRIMAIIRDELALTHQMVAGVLKRPINERRINHYYSTLLRSEALTSLHDAQVQLLKKWRHAKKAGVSEEDSCLFVLLQCVNAIANALGTTG